MVLSDAILRKHFDEIDIDIKGVIDGQELYEAVNISSQSSPFLRAFAFESDGQTPRCWLRWWNGVRRKPEEHDDTGDTISTR